ncbi:MAG: AAA family ATPase [Actinomycetales bacterium]|nr:AAA family ATPase [Actinomycetales bacterium]
MPTGMAHDTDGRGLTVEEHARLAGVGAQLARAFAASGASERRLTRTLIELEPLGYTLLADRRRAGGAPAGVDAVLVGPGGVFLLDVRDWSEVAVREGRVLHDGADASDEIARIADLAYLVQGELADVGLPAGEVHALIALLRAPEVRAELYGVRLLGEAAVVALVAGAGARLSAVQVATVRARLEQLFPPVITGPIGVIGSPHATAGALLPSRESARAVAATDGLDPARLLDLLEHGMRARPEPGTAFLDARQARLVRRDAEGPALVVGGSGTGKSLIGLHRAAHLARGGGRVLVTGPSGPLVRSLAARFATIAPDLGEWVVFRSVAALAGDLLTRTGERDPADEATLAAHGVADPDGLIAAALPLVRSTGIAPFAAIVVDEAHDVGPHALRLLHALVGDRPDGLLLLADPSRGPRAGEALAEAGIAVADRVAELDVDYRGTAQILAVVESLLPATLGARPRAVRSGEPPVLLRFAHRAERDTALRARLDNLLAAGADPAGIAVLALELDGAREAMVALAGLGAPVAPLADESAGEPAIRVGTVASAVGREFGQVLVTGAPAALLGPAPDPSRDPLDAWARARRDLAVAASRARDGLWIGVLDGPPPALGA